MRTKTILIVATPGMFAAKVLEGVSRCAAESGDWIFELHPPDQAKERHLEQRHYDALLMVGASSAPEWVGQCKGPVVSISHTRAWTGPSAHLDQSSVGRLGASYLLKKGYRHLAHVGVAGDPCSELQCRAFLKAAKEGGASGASLVVPDMGMSAEQIDALIAGWLGKQPRRTGLLAANDEVALQVCQACKIAGINIPDEVSVMGVDVDRHAAALCQPELSSIEVPAESLGFEGARLLRRLMNGETQGLLSLKLPPLRVREGASTEAAACSDAVVNRVVAHIRANAHRPCRVDDLAALAGVSRRILEKRFKKSLGQTVFEVIRHHQLALARRLLEDSDMPLDDIIEHTAFSSVSHLSVAMNKDSGISPGAYRKSIQQQEAQSQPRQQFKIKKAERLAVPGALRTASSNPQKVQPNT